MNSPRSSAVIVDDDDEELHDESTVQSTGDDESFPYRQLSVLGMMPALHLPVLGTDSVQLSADLQSQLRSFRSQHTHL